MDSFSSTSEGFYSAYDGGGYLVSLGDDETTATASIRRLREQNWLDDLSRALVVEFAVYNANSNLFTVVKIIVETPATGGIFLKAFVESFKPYPYVDAWDFILLVLQIGWVLLIIYFMVVSVAELVKKRFGYFREFWNCVQSIIIIMSITAIIMNIMRTASVIKAVENMKNNKGRYHIVIGYLYLVLNINI